LFSNRGTKFPLKSVYHNSIFCTVAVVYSSICDSTCPARHRTLHRRRRYSFPSKGSHCIGSAGTIRCPLQCYSPACYTLLPFALRDNDPYCCRYSPEFIGLSRLLFPVVSPVRFQRTGVSVVIVRLFHLRDFDVSLLPFASGRHIRSLDRFFGCLFQVSSFNSIRFDSISSAVLLYCTRIAIASSVVPICASRQPLRLFAFALCDKSRSSCFRAA